MKRLLVSVSLIVALAGVLPAYADSGSPGNASNPSTDGRMVVVRPVGASSAQAGAASNLTYQAGTGGVGVETAPAVYLVL